MAGGDPIAAIKHLSENGTASIGQEPELWSGLKCSPDVALQEAILGNRRADAIDVHRQKLARSRDSTNGVNHALRAW